MDHKRHAIWLDHAETAARWYLNNQCTEQKPWGEVYSNANLGRFLYEVYKATGKRRGAGNWAQALGIIDLLDLAQRTGEGRYKRAALQGAHYLVSLQNLDSRHPECSGGLWEHYPAEGIGMSRDMTTGCFGLAALARHTGDPDYCERTQLFCDWYMKHGRRSDGWPWRYFDYRARRGYSAALGSTPDCGIEHVEYLKLASEFGFNDMTDEIRASLDRTAAFGLTLQERDCQDPLYYGGLYGQSSYGVGRDRIHHRSTGYSINFYLKLEALENSALPWPTGFTAFGWG